MTSDGRSADDVQAVARDIVDLTIRRSPVLLGFDLDGTLSPIVSHSQSARLWPGALEMLMSLHRFDVLRPVIVTGRSRADAISTFHLPDDMTVIGSHGREMDDTASVDDADNGALDELTSQAEIVVAGVDGAWVERKPFSVVVHVRNVVAARRDEVLERFRVMVSGRRWDVLEGSAVLEVGLPPLDKGGAIDSLKSSWGMGAVCFVGDDVTDERVFQRLGPQDLGIKVGPGDTIARRRLPGPAEVVATFDQVAEALGAVR